MTSAAAGSRRSRAPYDWSVIRTAGIFAAGLTVGMALGRLISGPVPHVPPAEYVEMDPLLVTAHVGAGP